MRVRDVVGRTIVAVHLNRFSTGRSTGRGGKAWSFDPAIVLDNGSVIRFSVDETEIGEYGVTPVVHRKSK